MFVNIEYITFNNNVYVVVKKNQDFIEVINLDNNLYYMIPTSVKYDTLRVKTPDDLRNIYLYFKDKSLKSKKQIFKNK